MRQHTFESLEPIVFSQVIYRGGYCGGEPPLPIPNRAVKPACADGTGPPAGRVGGCRPLESPDVIHLTSGLSFFMVKLVNEEGLMSVGQSIRSS